MKKVLVIFAVIALTSCNKCVEDSVKIQKLKDTIKVYDTYYRMTEVMLDSIYMHDPDWFDDVLTEQDTYCDYIEAKTALDSIR